MLQMPLGLALREQVSFDTYLPATNGEAVAQLKACVRAEGEPYLYLWGGSGIGKSHLLQASCQEVHRLGGKAAYLPLSEQRRLSPQILLDLDIFDLVCLDDIEQVCGGKVWEQALFNLFNQLRDAGGRLIVSAGVGPSALPLVLADLQSRLEWGPRYHLQGLDDGERARLLQLRAAGRGLELPAETLAYIMAHTARDAASLLALLERLDRASLTAQRRLTVPFVRQILGSREP